MGVFCFCIPNKRAADLVGDTSGASLEIGETRTEEHYRRAAEEKKWTKLLYGIFVVFFIGYWIVWGANKGWGVF